MVLAVAEESEELLVVLSVFVEVLFVDLSAGLSIDLSVGLSAVLPVTVEPEPLEDLLV